MNLVSTGSFPIDALKEIDATLAKLGFRKEVHSVVKPGREFSATYSGPMTDKTQLEGILAPIAVRNHLTFTFDLDESVSFP